MSSDLPNTTVFVVLDAGEVIHRVYADYIAALEHAAEIDGSVLACEVIDRRIKIGAGPDDGEGIFP